jgi:DNA-binding MarR family transcriptional regulator/N-acetylglutamate synthase-like GNAT family acetyltransferase
MQPELHALVLDVRSASRELVRQLGVLNRTVAGSDFSPSAVHAIIEIDEVAGLTSKDLSNRLLLEKSTVSRLVRSLITRGEVREKRAVDDRRTKRLYLTGKGKRTLNSINLHANARVSGALERLDRGRQRRILLGLEDYSNLLEASGAAHAQGRSVDDLRIVAGYAPALSGRIIEMLLAHHSQLTALGPAFEARISADLGEFLGRLGSSKNEIWRAEIDGKIIGSITIDGENLGNGIAHLRWFVVDRAVRGGGAGGRLIERALEFCGQRKFRKVHLWTVKGLDTARHLYEKNGFCLAEEYRGDQWGAEVIEQKFIHPWPESGARAAG